MKVLSLLNANTLEQQLIYIIIGIASILLVAIPIIIVCSVRARKNRNKADALAADEKTVVEKEIEQQPVTNDAPEQAVAEEDSNKEASDADEENDEAIAVQLADASNGSGDIVYRRILYRRSFLARITQASDEAKASYSELKNELLSYDKVKSNLSWKHESFRIGRNTFACIVMRGKKLCLRFATDPKRFDGTKYHVVDLTERSPKSKQPCMYRITSERRVNYAKEIIKLLTSELAVEKLADYTAQNYVMPYRETEALIADGLIKVKIIEGVEGIATKVDNVEQSQSILRQTEQLPKRDFAILKQVEVTEVNVMSDTEAAKLIEYKVVKRKKSKGAKGIINIDVLSKKFSAGARITIDILHEMRIIPNSVNSIKVLANGVLDKPLIIEADDFSLAAVKMIALTGGRVIRTSEK